MKTMPIIMDRYFKLTDLYKLHILQIYCIIFSRPTFTLKISTVVFNIFTYFDIKYTYLGQKLRLMYLNILSKTQ